jgi:hypothetical protein
MASLLIKNSKPDGHLVVGGSQLIAAIIRIAPDAGKEKKPMIAIGDLYAPTSKSQKISVSRYLPNP